MRCAVASHRLHPSSCSRSQGGRSQTPAMFLTQTASPRHPRGAATTEGGNPSSPLTSTRCKKKTSLSRLRSWARALLRHLRDAVAPYAQCRRPILFFGLTSHVHASFTGGWAREGYARYGLSVFFLAPSSESRARPENANGGLRSAIRASHRELGACCRARRRAAGTYREGSAVEI
jgi:hypothetical protein